MATRKSSPHCSSTTSKPAAKSPGVDVRRVTVAQARCFAQARLGLQEPFSTVGDALSHHGYIQIDPINVCGRMHDLILRNRVRGYAEGDLMKFLHGPAPTAKAGERGGFEHHLPTTGILVALPFDAWPHLQNAMEARTKIESAWSGRLTAKERALVPSLLAELKERGPLSSGDVEDGGESSTGGWGTATLAKSTLQKLFFHGRLLIAGRSGNRRLYQLPEYILPPAVLSASRATLAETARWEVLTKLRQRRLTTLKKAELVLVADAVEAVEVRDADLPRLYSLREDAAHWDAPARETTGGLRLLAPLDPLIYERKVTKGLWGFDYTWEVYTPAAKRVRGYYALPALAGAAFVGHLEPKSDRKSGALKVVSRAIPRGHAWSEARRELATFLGLK